MCSHCGTTLRQDNPDWSVIDDTLREECQKLGFDWGLTRLETDELLAFARAQQAAGLREAAEIIKEQLYDGEYIDDAIYYLEAQATARESDATKKGSSPS
jgi:hypothetical protein